MSKLSKSEKRSIEVWAQERRLELDRKTWAGTRPTVFSSKRRKRLEKAVKKEMQE